MGRRFAKLAFTPLVKAEQEKHGSRRLYERAEPSDFDGDRLGPYERKFVGERDGFYIASVSETGWPYIQFRGGTKGFLQVVDDRTLGFADLRGNKQYISTGNLKHDDRVALFLMDYAGQRRMKILGHAEIHEGDADAEKWIASLRMEQEETPAERAVLIHVEGFDWNCPQHIVPRYSEEEWMTMMKPVQKRIAALEEENKRLREASAAAQSR